ncbi:hypothetical protein BLOT_015125 [Blomia tropicalis]|nr:hypothetical protein BLOT_015125 [Blomia tropicalis]
MKHEKCVHSVLCREKEKGKEGGIAGSGSFLVVLQLRPTSNADVLVGSTTTTVVTKGCDDLKKVIFITKYEI